jgi:hypothetical protein
LPSKASKLLLKTRKRYDFSQHYLKSLPIIIHQDNKPYILSMQAGPAQGHVRDQGYTFVTKSVFKNKEDMEFFEKECPAHEEYKVFLKKNAPVEGVMAVFFQAGFSYEL